MHVREHISSECTLNILREEASKLTFALADNHNDLQFALSPGRSSLRSSCSRRNRLWRSFASSYLLCTCHAFSPRARTCTSAFRSIVARSLTYCRHHFERSSSPARLPCLGPGFRSFALRVRISTARIFPHLSVHRPSLQPILLTLLISDPPVVRAQVFLGQASTRCSVKRVLGERACVHPGFSNFIFDVRIFAVRIFVVRIFRFFGAMF